MKSVFATSFAFVLFLVSVPGSAEGIFIEGELDCGKWITARTEKNSTPVEHYLIGLLNGLAFGSGVEIWNAQGQKMSWEQAFLWMDKYCRDKPLSDVFRGAIALAHEKTNGAFSEALGKRH